MHVARSATGASIPVEADVALGGAPQSGERFADDAVAATARCERAAHHAPPRPGLLADPAHLAAEQRRLPAGVGELGVGQRPIGVALGELDGLGEPVRRPVVRDRWPVALDLVPAGGQVVADAVSRLTPALRREQAVDPGQRPVGLAGVVLGVAIGDRFARRVVVVAQHGAGRLGLGDEEPGQPTDQVVVARVAGGQPALDEPGDEQRRRSDSRPTVEAHRRPPVALQEVLADPLPSTVGALEGTGDPRRGRLVEAHDRPGVADDVVRPEVAVVRRVVLVEPRAVVELVAREPVDGGRGAGVQRIGGDVRAVLRRRQHAERHHGAEHQSHRRQDHPPRGRVRVELTQAAPPSSSLVRRSGATDHGRAVSAARTTPSPAAG